jgi:hypothetical protein
VVSECQATLSVVTVMLSTRSRYYSLDVVVGKYVTCI